MTYDEAKVTAQGSVCGSCGGMLVVIRAAAGGEWTAACGRDRSHTGYRSAAAQRAAEDKQPPPSADLHQLEGQELQARVARAEAEGIPRLIPRQVRADLATGEVINREQARQLMEYAFQYGLDPFRGHVCLMHGEPYISHEGYCYYAAQQHEQYSLVSAPMAAAERDLYQAPEGSYAWLARCKRPNLAEPVLGQGYVTREEIEERSAKNPSQYRSPVVHNHPQQQAQKRAEWQALKRAFPLEAKREAHNGQTAH